MGASVSPPATGYVGAGLEEFQVPFGLQRSESDRIGLGLTRLSPFSSAGMVWWALPRSGLLNPERCNSLSSVLEGLAGLGAGAGTMGGLLSPSQLRGTKQGPLNSVTFS